MTGEAFLRIPPFPGHRAAALASIAGAGQRGTADGASLVAVLGQARVGGSYWAAQPDLPPGRNLLLAPENADQARRLTAQARAEGLAARAVLIGRFAAPAGIPVIAQLCDPWHLAGQAAEIRAGAGHELALVGALAGKLRATCDEGRFAGAERGAEALAAIALREIGERFHYRDPFTGAEIDARQAIALLAEWRQLIDANREIAAIHGIAQWKRVTLDALLWDGSGPVRHAGRFASFPASPLRPGKVLAWKTRTAPRVLAALAESGEVIGEIEDGMIRSSGLGANCVPPLSVIVDFFGAHFDPAQPSGLEIILQDAEIGEELVARAAALRGRLVQAGISKYGQSDIRNARRGTQRRVLVPGQVEDDRSVRCGGAGLTNHELLRRTRALEPGAWIIYKPHPDVESGHRKGLLPDAEVLRHADEIDRVSPITALFDSIDALHVITSLAGFEALMRGHEVITHGVPFYAGWGLTRDLGPVPPRRSRRRSLDALVAATLLLYPRYLDPMTRLPCRAETLVDRMAAGRALVTSPLVRLREWQGRLSRMHGWLTGRAHRATVQVG